MNKKGVMTWLGIILQIVIIFFGLGVVLTYLSTTTLSGWVGVNEKAELIYCTYTMYNLMSDTYVRDGNNIGLFDANFTNFFTKNLVLYYKNYIEVLNDNPISQNKYTPYKINLGEDSIVTSKRLTMTIVPQAKRLSLENRPRGNYFCRSYAFSPSGMTGYVEVSYD
jgi:hypothetical protein